MVLQQRALRPFPSKQALLLFAAGVALYLVLGALLGLASHNAHRFRMVFMEEDNLLDAIRLGVEQTHAQALLAASTGEQVFVARHKEIEQLLTTNMARLNEVQGVVSEPAIRSGEMGRLLEQLRTAQASALDMAARYELTEAWNLLRGIDYEISLTSLLGCINACDARVEEAADLALHRQETYSTAAIWCVVLFTPVFLLAGLTLVRRARLADRANRDIQSALAESERRFRGTFEQAAVGIAHVGLDGSFLRVNDRLCAITGYGAAELTSLTFSAITHPDDLDADLALAGQLLGGEIDSYTMDKRYLTKAGGEIWVTLTVTLVRDEAGKPLYFISVIQDVGARKAAEAAAGDSARTVRALLDATSDRVILVEASGRILAANAAAAAALGLAVDALVGKYLHEVFAAPLASARLSQLHRALETGLPQRFADERDGVVLDNIAAPMPGHDGLATRAALFARDVTTITRARQAAEAASRAKTEFLANMSHELRTPLNAILGMAQVLAGTALDADQQDCLGDVERASRALMGLVDDLIGLSAIETGSVVVVREPFLLRTLLRAVATTSEAAAAAKGLDFCLEADDDLPFFVRGDGQQLHEVLDRLIGNAIKFTAQGRVTLAVVCSQPCEAPGGGEPSVEIRFAVRDTGIGVAQEDQVRIFEDFIQADGSSTRRFGGTGLGLAISSRLVRLMGGEIALESEPGQGSVFYFTLRFELPELPAEVSEAPGRG